MGFSAVKRKYMMYSFGIEAWRLHNDSWVWKIIGAKAPFNELFGVHKDDNKIYNALEAEAEKLEKEIEAKHG